MVFFGNTSFVVFAYIENRLVKSKRYRACAGAALGLQQLIDSVPVDELLVCNL